MGDTLTVDDSWWDIASDDWYWFDNDDDGEDSAGDSIDASGNLYPRFNPLEKFTVLTCMAEEYLLVLLLLAFNQNFNKLKHIGMRQVQFLQLRR